MSDLAQLAQKVEYTGGTLQRLARVMRGEDEDRTGLGLWRITCQQFSMLRSEMASSHFRMIKDPEIEAAAIRVRSTVGCKCCPWELEIYARTDGRSPMQKYMCDLELLSRQFLHEHVSDLPEEKDEAQSNVSSVPVAQTEG